MLLTQRDVAKQLGISEKIVAGCTRAGVLNHILLPGHKKPRYLQKHVDEFLKRNEQCPDASDYQKT